MRWAGAPDAADSRVWAAPVVRTGQHGGISRL